MALVTGGSRGLGLLIARELATEGCRVAICARDAEELRRAEEDLRAHGAAGPLVLVCDVTDQAQVERLVAEVQARLGPIDVLVNDAGIISVGPAETMHVQDYADAMAVMYWGVVYPTLAVLPRMLARRRGRIVNITSIGGKVAVPHLLPYCTANFSAVGFSEGLRAELRGKGVTVTTIAPGRSVRWRSTSARLVERFGRSPYGAARPRGASMSFPGRRRCRLAATPPSQRARPLPKYLWRSG